MAHLFHRHPRYVALLALAILATLFLLNPWSDVPLDPALADNDLPARLDRAERIYQDVLGRRKGLIRKFGPQPKDIDMSVIGVEHVCVSHTHTPLTTFFFPSSFRCFFFGLLFFFLLFFLLAHTTSSFPPNVDPWPPYTVCTFRSHLCAYPGLTVALRHVQGTFSPLRSTALTRCNASVRSETAENGSADCRASGANPTASSTPSVRPTRPTLDEKKNSQKLTPSGINGDSTFEAEILEHTRHCQIWGYDFSVNSFGPQIPSSELHRTHFFAYGLGGADKHGPNDAPKMYTLASLMRMNGHSHIDVLKIDVEGWEFGTLETIVRPYLASDDGPLPFGQLQLEIHLWHKTFPDILGWWETLERAGLRPFMTEVRLIFLLMAVQKGLILPSLGQPNLVYVNYNRDKGTSDLAEYSFLNIKGDNVFIKDPVETTTSAPRHDD